ncbi:MAG: SurA N-terminal domain-containing protein [Verrucomicrobiota bacterium]
MISFLNRKFKGLLFIILILVAISFIFFVDFFPSAPLESQYIGSIEGEKIKRNEFESHFRETEVTFTLTTGQLASQMPQIREMLFSETWNRLITLKAAKKAGIFVGDEEIRKYITEHPMFMEEGVFAPERFRRFASVFFDPPGVQLAEGMNIERFESVVRNQLMIEKFRSFLQAAYTATPREVEQQISRVHGKSKIETASFSQSAISKSFKVDPEELQAFYQQNINRFLNPEKRRIEWVQFQLSAEDTKLEGDARKAKLRALGEQAFAFSDPFYNAQQDGTPLPDFSAQAQKMNLKIQESSYFTQTDTPFGPETSRKLVLASFSLKLDIPVSDAVEYKGGYAVIRLVDIQESQPKPFEAVEKEVTSQYKAQEIRRRYLAEGRKKTDQVKELLAQGTPWKEAIKQVKLRAGKSLEIVPAQNTGADDPVTRLANRLAATLGVGEVSNFENSGEIGFVFYVAGRTAPDASVIEAQKAQVQNQVAAQQASLLIRDWNQYQYNAPNTDIPVETTPSSY